MLSDPKCSDKAGNIDPHEAENHGRILNLAVLPHEGFETCKRGDVGITARIDDDARLDVRPTLLRPGADAFNPTVVHDHIGHGRVEKHLHPGVLQHVVRSLAPDQGVMHEREGLPVADRVGYSAPLPQQLHEAIGESEHDLLRGAAG